MTDWERFEVPGERNAVEYLTRLGNGFELDRAPDLFTDVPDDKALVWIVDNGPSRGGQLAYYVWCEPRLRDITRSSPESHEEAEAQQAEDQAASHSAVVLGGTYRPFTWMLVDRVAADRMVPRAAQERAAWTEQMVREAENAAHPDNLLPVARISRQWMQTDAQALLDWAAALRYQPSGTKRDDLLTDEDMQRVAATDLEAIGRKLERWSAVDWVAVLDPPWESDGPLPPWPDRSADS